MPLDANLIGQEFTPIDYRAANDKSNFERAQTAGEQMRTAGEGLENISRQQKIDLQTMATNAQRRWDQRVAENTTRVPIYEDEAPSAPQTPADNAAAAAGSQQRGAGAAQAHPMTPDGQVIPGPSQSAQAPTSQAPMTGDQMIASSDFAHNPTQWMGQIQPPAKGEAAPAQGLPGEAPFSEPPPEEPPTPTGTNVPQVGRKIVGYRSVTDYDKAIGDMRADGYDSYTIGKNKQIQEALKLGLENHNLSLEGDQKRAELLGASLAGMPQVDTSATPEIQEQQKALWKSDAMTRLQRGLQQGLIDPQHEQALAATVNAGWNPQIAAQIEGMAAKAKGYAENLKANLEQGRAAALALKTGADLKETQGKIDKQDLETYTQTVRAAQNADDLNGSFTRAPKSVQDVVGPIIHNPELTVAQKVAAISDLGITPEQKVRAREADARIAETQREHQMLDDHRNERESFLEEQKEAGKNIDKAQAGRDYTELVKLQDQQRKLDAVRVRLGQQLTNAGKPVLDSKGKPDPKQASEFQYIQENGTTKPSSMMRDPKTKKPDPAERAAAISDMQSRYDAVTDSLKGIVNQKHDITKDTGRVSRAQELASYDNAAPATTKPTATTPAAKATPTPATATIPDAVKKSLKEGQITTFKNGQRWTLRNGTAEQVH